MRRTLVPSLVAVLSFACLVPSARAADTSAEPEARGAASIGRGALMQTDAWLASPAFAGRLAGSPGYLRAARAMAPLFAKAGLRPGGEDGFFQHLDVEYNEIETCALARVDAGGTAHVLRLGPDFTCRGLTGSGRIDAPVVFAGYGVSWPERGYDDYAGLDVRGKVVLVIKEPPPFSLDSAGWGERTMPRPRARAAAAHGAVALLMVPAPNQPHPQQPIASMLEGPGPEDAAFPAMQLAVPVAQEFLAGSGAELSALQSAIDSTHAPHSRVLATRARIGVRARYHAQQGSLNVVGVLPGADPALRGQFVVVGAHLDHVGTQAGLRFSGANDNASGASAVLEIARAFRAAGMKPRRTVVFALFSSEESGLQGSRHFAAHPPQGCDSVVAYLNLDCVGVGDSIQVGGGTTWTQMWQVARAADEREAHRLMQATWPGGGADAESFSSRGIPIAYFASHPSYTYLHLPGDVPETLNPGLLEAIARTAFRTAWTIAMGAATR